METNMHMTKRLSLVVATIAGFGVAPLIAQNSTVKTVPLTADISVVSVRTLSDGNTIRQDRTMKFYRRVDGSTRVEEPNRVVIVDNSSHMVTVLDTVGKIAQVQHVPTASTNGRIPAAALSRPSATGNSLSSVSGSSNTDLGMKLIAGYIVRGVERSTKIPANSSIGNTAALTKTIQVWRSSDLRLPLLTVISDPVGGTITSQYENISTANPPDDSLFTVPSDYKTVPAPQSRITSSHTN
jgi:hypothetical protein